MIADEMESHPTKPITTTTPKKLVLILDLDHTLLHSVSVHVNSSVGCNEAKSAPSQSDNIGATSQALKNIDNSTDSHGKTMKPPVLYPLEDNAQILRPFPVRYTTTYLQQGFPCTATIDALVKVRPYARRFLKEMSQRFDIYIYTNAQREYANAVIPLLDPACQYIKGCIANDNPMDAQPFKDIRSFYQGSLQDVVILDDRIDVWIQKQNVLWIVPYVYWNEKISDGGRYSNRSPFPVIGNQTMLPVPRTTALSESVATTESGKIEPYLYSAGNTKYDNLTDTRSEDSVLLTFMEILTSLHAASAACTTSYVPNAMGLRLPSEIASSLSCPQTLYESVQYLRQNLFKGLHFLFLSPYAPQCSSIFVSYEGGWAYERGATCHDQLNNQVTHLLVDPGACQNDENFIKPFFNVFSQFPNIRVVDIQWFYACLSFMRRWEETPFLCIPNSDYSAWIRRQSLPTQTQVSAETSTNKS